MSCQVKCHFLLYFLKLFPSCVSQLALPSCVSPPYLMSLPLPDCVHPFPITCVVTVGVSYCPMPDGLVFSQRDSSTFIVMSSWIQSSLVFSLSFLFFLMEVLVRYFDSCFRSDFLFSAFDGVFSSSRCYFWSVGVFLDFCLVRGILCFGLWRQPPAPRLMPVFISVSRQNQLERKLNFLKKIPKPWKAVVGIRNLKASDWWRLEWLVVPFHSNKKKKVHSYI